jgi:plasmid maintenance system antidote protein VapI
MAMKRSKALEGSAQFCLDLQKNWELRQLDETNFLNIEHIAV